MYKHTHGKGYDSGEAPKPGDVIVFRHPKGSSDDFDTKHEVRRVMDGYVIINPVGLTGRDNERTLYPDRFTLIERRPTFMRVVRD